MTVKLIAIWVFSLYVPLTFAGKKNWSRLKERMSIFTASQFVSYFHSAMQILRKKLRGVCCDHKMPTFAGNLILSRQNNPRSQNASETYLCHRNF
jgi:hypothetical protein